MPKRYITVGNELDKVFTKASKQRGAPYASVVREAMEEWAKRRGYQVEDTVSWGGARFEEEETKGQPAGALAS